MPAAWRCDRAAGSVLFEKPVLTNPRQKRIAVVAPVRSLDQIVIELKDKGFEIEHAHAALAVPAESLLANVLSLFRPTQRKSNLLIDSTTAIAVEDH